MKDIYVVKTNGNLEKFDPLKIKKAITASAERVMVDLTEEAKDNIKVNDEDISELSIQEQDGGLNIKAKTNEITISMKKITIFLQL